MPVNMLIKQLPDDLKSWIEAEARRHHRSMNKETIALLEKARAEGGSRTSAKAGSVDDLLRRFRALPDLDGRREDEILGYGEHGLPT